MGKKRVNKYPKAFRLMAPERMKNWESVCALAEELGIHRTVLFHWRNHLKAVEGRTASSAIRELRKQVRDLKRVLVEKTLEVGPDYFRIADNTPGTGVWLPRRWQDMCDRSAPILDRGGLCGLQKGSLRLLRREPHGFPVFVGFEEGAGMEAAQTFV